MSAEQYAATIRDARAVAHRAVTEGVNLKYVDVLRRTTYELADLAAALLEQQQQQDQRIKELEATAEAVARERDEANQHLGVDPSMERIREAHSAMTALDPESRQGWHLAYKQGHDERCYICTLLDRAVRAERERDIAHEDAHRIAHERDDALDAKSATERLLDEARRELNDLRAWAIASAPESVLELIDGLLARLDYKQSKARPE